MNPRVSIILSTYNRSGLIERAIRSVVDQSFTDWELIVIDDGSTDATSRVVGEWKEREPRIAYLKNETNLGISKSYNRGFRTARGEYIAMIDDDDPWCGREKLKKQVFFLDEHPDTVGCGGGMIVIDVEGKELFRYLKPETDSAIRKCTLFSNPMANSTTLFRRSAGEKVGWYSEESRYSGDRDFWMKMGLVGMLYNFPEYFSFYRMSGENTSITHLKPHLKASLDYMKRYKGKYPSYHRALLFNRIQYAYSFLPVAFRRRVHRSLSWLKRKLF